MGLSDTLRLGKKVITGAFRLGKKAYGLYKRVMGGKNSGDKESYEARDKFEENTKSISSDDFVVDNPPQPPPMLMTTRDRERARPTNTQSAISTLEGSRNFLDTARNLKLVAKESGKLVGEAKQVRGLGDIQNLRENAQRTKELINLPPARKVKAVSDTQRQIQRSLVEGNTDISRMTEKELKKFMRKREKASKKRSKRR